MACLKDYVCWVVPALTGAPSTVYLESESRMAVILFL